MIRLQIESEIKNMNKSELTFYIVILSVLCIWQTVLLIREFKKIKSEPSGMGKCVYVVKWTPKWLVLSGVLIGLYIAYLAKSMFSNLPFEMLFMAFIIYFEGVIYECLKRFRSIKIYEKGIVYPLEGGILWENIETIEIDRTNRNRILLKRKEYQCDYLKIECMNGLVNQIMEYIQMKIDEA